MTKDIAPDLMERITSDFQENMKNSSEIQELAKKISKKTAMYREAQEYAIKTSEIMSDALLSNISADMLPDGKLYYNIAQRILQEALGESGTYGYIGTYCDEVQRILNEAANVEIRPVTPKLNQDRINGIVDIVSGKDNFDEIKYMLAEPIVNYGQAIVDEAVRCNADFQFKSGLSPKITRISTGNCCEWCDRLAGTYDYETIKTGSDVWKRHKHCRCLVEYHPGNGKRQNVHTKQWKDEAAIEKRKSVGLGEDLKKDPKKLIARMTGSRRVQPLKNYEVNGTSYKVDGKHVLLDHSKNEKAVAQIVANHLDKPVYLVPRVLSPKGISTPDYLIGDARYDLKSPTGKGKNTLFDMVSKKKKQADNFIFDVSKCSLSREEVNRQIGNIYKSKHTSFVKDIIIVKDGKIIDTYHRE